MKSRVMSDQFRQLQNRICLNWKKLYGAITVRSYNRNQEAELDIIRQKMQEVGVRNMGAYLRKMAMDGYCIRLDLGDLKKVVSLMRYASNNLNQYARKANETGSIYLEDIQDLQKRFDQIWEELKGIHTRLASIE